jgi:hypothetical protein
LEYLAAPPVQAWLSAASSAVRLAPMRQILLFYFCIFVVFRTIMPVILLRFSVHRGQKMDGPASSSAAGHDRGGRFVNGHSEYAARRRRVAERLQELCAGYDASSPVNRQLLSLAAQHLDDAAVTRIAAKRASSTRAAMKILDRIPRNPAPAQLLSARELLDRLRP